MIEHATTQRDNRTISHTEIRAAGKFSPSEVRDLMCERHGLGQMVDFRQLGCPDHIFAFILEKRAEKIGYKRTSENITDAERRDKAAKVAALIQADRDAEYDRNARLD